MVGVSKPYPLKLNYYLTLTAILFSFGKNKMSSWRIIMSFVDEFKNASLLKTTENGGVAYSKLDNDLLSFFAIVGAMRNRSEKDIIDMYMAARNEDKELADKIVLYARDIRGGGLGERRVGRILLKELAKLDPTKVIRNFANTDSWIRF